MKPVLTVALPVYNSKTIIWLALQSLVNQRGIDFEWELIILEEKQNGYGKENYEKWSDSLRKNGCSRIVCQELDEWISLPLKWLKIGELASDTSKAFLLQAADCYSYPLRLKHTHEVFCKLQDSYDWFHTGKGIFYEINLDITIMYNHSSFNHPTALNMAFKTEYVKKMVAEEKPPLRGIDAWLFNKCKELKGENLLVCQLDEQETWEEGVDTNGSNNISLYRYHYFNYPKPPFAKTELKVSQFLLDKLLVIKKINEDNGKLSWEFKIQG